MKDPGAEPLADDEEPAAQDEVTPYKRPGESDLVLVPLMARLLGNGLKAVSLDARRDPNLPRLEAILEQVQPDEGIERIFHELRTSPVLSPIEGGLAIEVVPTAAPEDTFLPVRNRVNQTQLERMAKFANQDPARVLESHLPVGLAFDMMDMVPDQDFLQASEAYTGIYDTFIDSFSTVVLHRDAHFTWLLTGWHQITNFERRLKLRTSLQKFSPVLSKAFGRVGLFGNPPDAGVIEPAAELASIQGPVAPRRNCFVPGWSPDSPRRQTVSNDQRTDEFTTAENYDNIGSVVHSNPNGLKTTETPPLADWTVEALETRRAELEDLLKDVRGDLNAVNAELRSRLEFARVIPVRTFSASAVSISFRRAELT